MFELHYSIENGWILSLMFLLISYVPMIFGGNGAKRLVNFSWMNKRGKMLSFIVLILFLLIVILPIFNRITDNEISIIIGFFLFASGVIGIITSYINYFATPINELIVKGMYKKSRNPIYVSTLISFIGIAVLCESFLLGVLFLIYFIVQHPIIKEEERFCENNFGEEYQKYKQKTRRYL